MQNRYRILRCLSGVFDAEADGRVITLSKILRGQATISLVACGVNPVKKINPSFLIACWISDCSGPLLLDFKSKFPKQGEPVHCRPPSSLKDQLHFNHQQLHLALSSTSAKSFAPILHQKECSTAFPDDSLSCRLLLIDAIAATKTRAVPCSSIKSTRVMPVVAQARAPLFPTLTPWRDETCIDSSTPRQSLRLSSHSASVRFLQRRIFEL